jgi:hypothetical protein
MGSTPVPTTNGAAAPYGPTQGACGRVWRHNGWFACLGRKNEDTPKNREIRQALALGGRCSMMRDNNQLGVGGRVWWDVGEEVRESCSVWDGGVQLFEVTNSAHKKSIM